MKLNVLTLACLIFTFGCEGESSPEIPKTDPDKEKEMEEDTTSIPTDTLRYLALGDSYTIGESVAEKDRWPNQLQARLASNAIPILKPDILARTGWTTNELRAAINQSSLKDEYQLVSLLIGVNNQYRGYPQSQQKEDFELLIKRAIAFAQGDTSRVFVVSIPDYGATPFGQERNGEKIGQEIDEYNAINQAICETYGVRYFDITPISREALTNSDLVAEDGLHPSGRMYQRWVNDVILEGVRSMLIP